MSFTVGQRYSRRDISKVLGGSIQSYLPTVKCQVVCGCFKPTAKKNPDAPEKVTIGTIGRPEPWLVAKQDAIPIFLFRANSSWEYYGRYRCTGLNTDTTLIESEMKANPARGIIAGVLYFERVGD